MNSNLPTEKDEGKQEIRQFFNNYFDKEISFPSNLIDAVYSFFVKRGFDDLAARSTSIVLLNQSRIDNVNVFELLEKLNNLSDAQLGVIITQILNANRTQTSVLGFKVVRTDETFESRNILV